MGNAEPASKAVRWIFARFLEIGSGTELAREVAKRGIRTPRGNRTDKKYRYRMLNNRVNIGEALHRGTPASIPQSSNAMSGTRFTSF